MSVKERPSPEFIELLKRSGDSDKSVAIQAQREIAKALELPLRKGVVFGDIVGGIFEAMPLEPGATPEFPLDLLAPGSEIDHVAFTNPGNGRIPERHVEGDYVMINTYGITSAIDFLLKYAREANWNVVARAMQVLESSFVKKINDDGWHTLLAAAVDRNILVYDADAAAGQFTKRLVSLMKTVMRRNGGGNSVTAPGRLTDLYLSPEAIEDIRNWGMCLNLAIAKSIKHTSPPISVVLWLPATLNLLSVLIRVQTIVLLCPSRRMLRSLKTKLFIVTSDKATMDGPSLGLAFSTTVELSLARSKNEKQ